MKNHIIILAGGKGTRMNSQQPKVLHKIKNSTLIDYVLKNTSKICSTPTIIIGHKGDEIINHTNNKYNYIKQKHQLGTGHAILCAKKNLFNKPINNIVVLPGDHPCINPSTLENLIKKHEEQKSKITITTLSVPNFDTTNDCFYSFGRIIRNNNQITNIVELKDTNEKQKNITEVNIGYCCFDAKWLWRNISDINNHNNSKEYYLTDLIHTAFKQNETINSITINNPIEGLGVNTPEQLLIVKQILKNT